MASTPPHPSPPPGGDPRRALPGAPTNPAGDPAGPLIRPFPRDLQPLLKALVKDPAAFSPAQAAAALHIIMADGGARVTPAQVAGLLAGLAAGRRDADPAVIHACAQALRAHARPPFPRGAAPGPAVDWVDIVGTGGDGQNTFNVSTTAALVAAACGVHVAKHGNRASSSSCGSADLLEAVCAGSLASLTPATLPAFLAASPRFVFLFAQVFHPAMAVVAQARRELGTPTVFNLIGPLANPLAPARLVVGVHSPALGRLMADALVLGGCVRGLVVCGREGLDEISPAGPTDVWEIRGSEPIRAYAVGPEDFGLAAHPLSAVSGGRPAANAGALADLVAGRLAAGHPVRDFVLANTAALLVVAGKAANWRAGVALAADALDSGAVRATVEGFVQGMGRTLTR